MNNKIVSPSYFIFIPSFLIMVFSHQSCITVRNRSAKKWVNIIAGIITLAVLVTAAPSAAMDDAFHIVIEAVAISWIFRIALKLPSLNKTETPHLI